MTERKDLVFTYQIPEKYKKSSSKHKRRSKLSQFIPIGRFKKRPKQPLWQYKEDQVKLFKEPIRPASARTLFRNNLSKRKDLLEMFELVKKPTLINAFKQNTKHRPKTARTHVFSVRRGIHLCLRLLDKDTTTNTQTEVSEYS